MAVSLHNLHLHLTAAQLAESRRHLVVHSAHDFPPALSCFAGLGFAPCNVYRVVSFDKLHVMDLGIIRQFCDMTKSFLQRASSLPLSRLMSIAKDRYFSLPYSAGLFLHRPFRSTQQDSQAGISGNIRRESVPFLWVCIMGLADFIPDPDPLLQCALRLDVVNDVLCTPSAWILSEINAWQRYVLEFSI